MIDSGTLTGNGNAEIAVSPVKHVYQGVKRELITEDIGDGTGNVNLEVSPDGSKWFTRSAITLGTPLEFNAYPGESFRIIVDSGTSPDMNWWVF